MTHRRINDLCTGDWTLASIKERVFLNPEHEKQSTDSENGYDRLKRDKEASKDEQIYDIDVLIPNLELDSFTNLV